MAIDTVNSLLTLSGVKSYLGNTSTGTADDAKYNRIINAVSHTFNTYTGRKLKKRTYSTSTTAAEGPEYRDGDGSNRLMARQYPIVGTPMINIDPDRAYSTDHAVSSTDIIVYADEGIIELDDDAFDAGSKSVKMSYAAGYTVTSTSSSSTQGTLPYDLEYAALEFARFYNNREKSNRVGVRSESIDGQAISYETDMPWSVKKILDLYRDYRSA